MKPLIHSKPITIYVYTKTIQGQKHYLAKDGLYWLKTNRPENQVHNLYTFTAKSKSVSEFNGGNFEDITKKLWPEK